MGRILFAAALVMALLMASVATADEEGIAFFEKRIRPVLASQCYKCHSAQAAVQNELAGGLQLDTRAGLLAGGESGPVFIAGNPTDSSLIRALKHLDLEMPPSQRLPDEVIADFERWIEIGAPDPRDGEAVVVQTGIDYEQGRKHWAYQPLDPGPVPDVQQQEWPSGDVDRYVLARIESAGLKPTADATRFAVLRRLCFDLTGLPPTTEQVDRFERLSDQELPAAYETLVDELLASPQFGVQWARHWQDGVRFDEQLESSAYYRNWLVDAFNEDMPYDEFVERQIAGDLLPADNDTQASRNLIGVQMLAYNIGEADFVEGSLEVLGQQLLGISLNCAKCHDHKYDAVSQEDYYALAGVLQSSRAEKSARDGLMLPGTDTKVIGLAEGEPKRIGDTHLLYGGDRDRRGELIPRRLPKVFFEGEPPSLGSETASGRLELARWVGDLKNPLLSRVAVNRIWLRLMGRGIVATPNDFGVNGDPPTQPKLLDYLAAKFIESGGSTKAVVRAIATSRAYRLAVQADAETIERDPENIWLARANPKRLQFEQIMDGLLAVAGELELEIPEPVVPIKQWPTRRRKDKSYGGPRALFIRDQSRESATFDGPSTELLVEERSRSVTAPQLLFLLNSEMVRNLVPKIAERIHAETGEAATADRVRAAYRLLFARPAESEEVALGIDFVDRYGLERYVHTLLLVNEFLYLD